MLRMSQSKVGANAGDYLTPGLDQQDYLSDGQNERGVWMGEAARRLRLEGEVGRRAFVALAENRHPESGERLTLRTKANRRPGYDFNFHCPKSVSLAYSVYGDERVLPEFRRAVRETMGDIEADAQTRVRRRGTSADRRTGNLAWAEFTHFTSRPVDGIPDPQLHAHCYVFNATFDPTEQCWKAVQFGPLKRDAPYYEALFLSRLAEGMHRLGYDIVPSGRFWELEGTTREEVERFSRRSAEVERAARDRGVQSPGEKAGLGARTRRSKSLAQPAELVREDWRRREAEFRKAGPRHAPGRGAGRTSEGEGRLRPGLDGRAPRAVRDAVDHAIGRVFDRSAVVAERRLIEEALRLAPGRVDRAALEAEIGRREMVRREEGGRVLVTLPDLVQQERRMVSLAEQGRGRHKPLLDSPVSSERSGMTGSQLQAVNHVLRSRDAVTLVDGVSGSGKTAVLSAVRQELENSGLRRPALAAAGLPSMLVLSPNSAASRDRVKAEGAEQAVTVREFLESKGERFKGALSGVVWVDEANRVGTRDMVQLMESTRAGGARLILCGDTRAKNAVAHGDCMRVLQEHAGLPSARLDAVKRQRGEHRNAVEAASRSDGAGALGHLDRLGAVRQVPAGELAARAADEYVRSGLAGRNAMVITPSRAEAEAVNREVRSRLRESGSLRKERSMPQLRAVDATAEDLRRAGTYRSGQVVQFHKNARGFTAGSRWNVRCRDPFGNVVVTSKGSLRALPLGQADRFRLYEKGKIDVGLGEKIRITRSTLTCSALEAVYYDATWQGEKHKRHLNAGSVHTVKRFTRDGRLHLDNGLVVPKDFGHIEHAYSTTLGGADARRADRVIICSSKKAGPSRSAEQFYESLSKGTSSAVVYTDSRAMLERAVTTSSREPSPLDLERMGREQVRKGIERSRQAEQARVSQPAPRPIDKGRDRG